MAKGSGGTRGGGASARGGGGTLQDRLNKVFGNADVEGIGKIALSGEISDFKVDKETPTMKHISYKYKGQDNPLTHPSLRPSTPNGWHGLTYAKDSEGWYIDDFS